MWDDVILLTDSLRNNDITYANYIGNKGFDAVYCEAPIATERAVSA